MDTKPKRRWFRYSLRTLLFLVTIAGVGFGWLGYKMRQAERQRVSVEALHKLGWRATYFHEKGLEYKMQRPPPRPGPSYLRSIFGDHLFMNVISVYSNGPLLSDADLIHLEGLPQLEDLALGDVTDAGLIHLRGLAQLKTLGLPNNRISDCGLVNLRGLTQLEYLDLTNTGISDAGLANLRGLPRLEVLHLHGTRVTNEGRDELQKALPKLKIFP